jgi:hypothetical protein
VVFENTQGFADEDSVDPIVSFKPKVKLYPSEAETLTQYRPWIANMDRQLIESYSEGGLRVHLRAHLRFVAGF